MVGSAGVAGVAGTAGEAGAAVVAGLPDGGAAGFCVAGVVGRGNGCGVCACAAPLNSTTHTLALAHFSTRAPQHLSTPSLQYLCNTRLL